MSDRAMDIKEKDRETVEGIRLNRLLGESGLCSRREADRLIEAGRVTVDGRPAQMGQKILPHQKVAVDGRVINGAGQVRPRILAVHKPVGVVCTTDRRWGDRLLEDLLDIPERVFPVGRLDKMSDGLILMTNQGDLANEIMKACNYHEKEYVVTVDKPVTEEFVRKMSRGVYLQELKVKTRACDVLQTDRYSFRIVLTQGLNRQIRRMCKELGYQVRTLTRVRILNVVLEDLKAGAYRDLKDEEAQELRRLLTEGRKKNHF